jgi:hypothetical protein
MSRRIIPLIICGGAGTRLVACLARGSPERALQRSGHTAAEPQPVGDEIVETEAAGTLRRGSSWPGMAA